MVCIILAKICSKYEYELFEFHRNSNKHFSFSYVNINIKLVSCIQMFIHFCHYSLIEQLKAVKLVQNYLVLEKLQKAHSSIIKTYALYYVRKKISASYSFLYRRNKWVQRKRMWNFIASLNMNIETRYGNSLCLISGILIYKLLKGSCISRCFKSILYWIDWK